MRATREAGTIPTLGAPSLRRVRVKPHLPVRTLTEAREKQGEGRAWKGQSKESDLRVPQAAGSHLVGTSCSAELGVPFLRQDGRRHRAFRKHLRSQEKGGRAPSSSSAVNPERRTPVTIYRGWWAGLTPVAQSPQALSTPPKSKLAWPVNAAESAARGTDRDTHFHKLSASPGTGRLDQEAALPAPVNNPTHLLCELRGSSRSQENTEAAHLGLATRLPRDSRFGSREGIKKKKAGKRQKICRKFPRLSKGTSIHSPTQK